MRPLPLVSACLVPLLIGLPGMQAAARPQRESTHYAAAQSGDPPDSLTERPGGQSDGRPEGQADGSTTLDQGSSKSTPLLPPPSPEPTLRTVLIDPGPGPGPEPGTAASAHEARRGGLALRAVGWSAIGAGGAATVAGLLLLPLRPAELPVTEGVVPILAVGAALLIGGRILLSASAAH